MFKHWQKALDRFIENPGAPAEDPAVIARHKDLLRTNDDYQKVFSRYQESFRQVAADTEAFDHLPAFAERAASREAPSALGALWDELVVVPAVKLRALGLGLSGLSHSLQHMRHENQLRPFFHVQDTPQPWLPPPPGAI